MSSNQKPIFRCRRIGNNLTRSGILKLCLVSVIMFWGVAGCVAPGRFIVKMDKQDIQIKLDERFPIREKRLVFEIRFEEPMVSFTQGDRIEIGLQIEGFMATVPVVSTHAVISGRVSYDAERYEFLLTDLHVDSLELAHVPEAKVDAIRAAVDRVANANMPRIPIYRLDAKKHRLKRFLLKRAWVQDGQLYLEMGI